MVSLVLAALSFITGLVALIMTSQRKPAEKGRVLAVVSMFITGGLLGLLILTSSFGGSSQSDRGLRAEVSLVEERPHGPYVLYDRNGKVLARGMFENGHREGIWTFWSAQGDKLANTTYLKGLKEGPWHLFYRPESPSTAVEVRTRFEGTFAADQLDGEMISYYPSGADKCTTKFQHGEFQRASCLDPRGIALPPTESFRMSDQEQGVITANFSWMNDLINRSLGQHSGSESARAEDQKERPKVRR